VFFFYKGIHIFDQVMCGITRAANTKKQLDLMNWKLPFFLKILVILLIALFLSLN